MRHARLNGNQADIVFGTYLDRQERDQLDARAATAEQERDDALDDRDTARRQRDDLHHELTQTRDALTRAGLQPNTTASTPELVNRLADDLDSTRQVATDRQTVINSQAAELQHVGQVLTAWRNSFQGEPAQERDRVLVDLIDAQLVPTAERPLPLPGLGSPAGRAQDGIRPAAWEQQATDAASAGLGEAWCVLSTDPTAARRLATAAVRAIIDAGLAGPGGRCRKCGTAFPRTLPADQDPLCWSCDSEEQVGLDEPAARAQDEPVCGDPEHRHHGPCSVYARAEKAEG